MIYLVARSHRNAAIYCHERGLELPPRPGANARALHRPDDLLGVRWQEGDRLIDLDGWWDIDGQLRLEAIEGSGFPRAAEYRGVLPDLTRKAGRKMLARRL